MSSWFVVLPMKFGQFFILIELFHKTFHFPRQNSLSRNTQHMTNLKPLLQNFFMFSIAYFTVSSFRFNQVFVYRPHHLSLLVVLIQRHLKQCLLLLLLWRSKIWLMCSVQVLGSTIMCWYVDRRYYCREVSHFSFFFCFIEINLFAFKIWNRKFVHY